MSCGSLPPVPGLIPISALRRSPSCNNNSNNDIRECTPCATIQKEVMGEQRSRRILSQPTVELIDIAKRSRVSSATPQAPPSGKTRAERHRKSDRRRSEHRGDKKRSTTKREKSLSEEESCVNPRVNPIFVWVRQENTHIVDVKCEDYDKRNRIVLTKTPQGWRAIPRTETLVPNLKAAVNDSHQSRKIKKTHRVKRKSAAVQADEEVHPNTEEVETPTWSVPINIESHLPSHTIPIHKKHSSSSEDESYKTVTDEANINVNTSADQDYSAQASNVKCSANKICDVTPLDNLLAVAELEFNQQIQTEAWCESENLKLCDSNQFDVSLDESKNDDCDQLFSQTNSVPNISNNEVFDSEEEKDDDCDYNEDDENNLAMNDILTRLEQSLQSPDAICAEATDNNITSNNYQEKESLVEELDNNDVEEAENFVNELISQEAYNDHQEHDEMDYDKSEIDDIVLETKEEPPSSTTTIMEPEEEVLPTDLTTSKILQNDLTSSLSINVASEDDLMPTDLSLPKKQLLNLVSPRPSSRCSETIQSPQPSGLPAVPHSPDVQMKPAYLEALLSTTTPKMLNLEMHKQKEPLDFGKCRKSASPTVTCSEEINSSINYCKRFDESEPEIKKAKLEDVHLRTMLEARTNPHVNIEESKVQAKVKASESSRLLELLTCTSESEVDALSQFKQLQADTNLNLPDPMLVPKDRLSQIILSPGKEIPRLLSRRPELRLPEALSFPHLLHDPDILVITLSQIETIIRKQSHPVSNEKVIKSHNMVKKVDAEFKCSQEKSAKPHRELTNKAAQPNNREGLNKVGELSNDFNFTNANALNHMMWLPYLHQLEVAAMAFGNGTDFLKMISTFPPYSNHVPDFAQMLPLNRYPQPGYNLPSNPFELSMWQEAANHARNGNQYDRSKTSCRDYMDKNHFTNGSKTQNTPSHKYLPNKSHHLPPSSIFHQNNSSIPSMQHPFISVPTSFPTHNNMKSSLQIPQFNSIMSQKNFNPNKNIEKPQSTTNCDYKSSYKIPSNNHKLYNQKSGSLVNNHSKPKVSKNVPSSSSLSHENYVKKPNIDFVTQQPMDLSGSNDSNLRQGRNFYGSDSFNSKSSLKLDDIPEVGSTTIEDMTTHLQDSQKHLWHPLFGKYCGCSLQFCESPKRGRRPSCVCNARIYDITKSSLQQGE